MFGMVHILIPEALCEAEMRTENFDEQIWVTQGMGSELEKGFCYEKTTEGSGQENRCRLQ